MSASSLFAGSSLDTRHSFLGSRMPVSLLGGKVRGQILVSSVGDSSQVGQQMLITALGSPSLWPECLLGTCAYIPWRLGSDQIFVSLKTADLIQVQGFFHTIWRHSAGQLSEYSPVILCVSQECGSQRVWVSQATTSAGAFLKIALHCCS